MVKIHTYQVPLAAIVAATMLVGSSFATRPASAQASDSSSSADYPPPAPLQKLRRNDAYQPADNGPGLGTVTGPGTNAQSGSSYANPYAKGAAGAQSAPNDGYTPRYSEPVRPYASGAGAATAPAASYGGNSNGAYPAGNAGGNPGSGTDGYRPWQGGNTPEPYGRAPVAANQGGYDQSYGAPTDRRYDDRGGDRYDQSPGPRVDDRDRPGDGTYARQDIVTAGGNFFGAASQGLGQIVESLFKRQGRPNGYILGDEGGGAFVAGLRYGQGTLYTRDAGSRRIYWQGPTVGWDFGGAGSKVMILVYNLRSVDEIYDRFGGIDGSAYFVGGLGMTLLTRDHITVAPIRTGVGLRLGANVGYLKFTPKATWNPF